MQAAMDPRDWEPAAGQIARGAQDQHTAGQSQESYG
jgi:hypothetical protein